MLQSSPVEMDSALVHKIFLYCSCQFTKLGFISLFENSPVQVDIIPVDSPDYKIQQSYKYGVSLLVIFGYDDSLYLSARAAWFKWCWKQNTLTNKSMCVHMYSERCFSYCNGRYDFPANGSAMQIKKHIVKLLNDPKLSDFTDSRSINLTPREKKFMSFVYEGLSVRDIAGRMELNEKTILVVRMTIIKKMGLKNRNYIHSLKWLNNLF